MDVDRDFGGSDTGPALLHNRQPQPGLSATSILNPNTVASLQNKTLLLALPRLAPDHLRDTATLDLLARGRVLPPTGPADVLDRILDILNLQAPLEGRAALRRLGASNVAPDGWLAAADPVHMETCIDHLRVRDVPAGTLDATAVAGVFDTLDRELGTDETLAFETHGGSGYIRLKSEELLTPALSALAVDGLEPAQFMASPAEGPGGAHFQRLHAEIQMVLHETPLAGSHPRLGPVDVNALWVWGGGQLPEVSRMALPALFSDDDLIRGYWRAAGCRPESAPAELPSCLPADGSPCIVVETGRTDSESLTQALGLLGRGRVKTLIVLLGGRVQIELRRCDRYRFWRRRDPALDLSDELR